MSAWSRQVVKLMTGGLLGLVLLSGRSGAIASEPQLEGWVRLASGQPAAGVQVRLFDLTDPRRSVGTTADFALRRGTLRWPLPAQPTPNLKASRYYRTIPILSILRRLSPTSYRHRLTCGWRSSMYLGSTSQPW